MFGIPEPIIYIGVIAFVLWYILGKKKSIKKLRKENDRLHYQVSIEHHKQELKELKNKERGNRPKSYWDL